MVNSISSLFDPQVLQQARDALFAKIDVNGDGSIDKSELLASLTKKQDKSSQVSNIDDFLNQLLAKLDTNNDGVISEDELLKALQAAIQKEKDDLFAKIDTNGDGKIDKSELSAALTKAHKHHHHRHAKATGQTQDVGQLVDKIFAKLDTNNDGAIDKSEFESTQTQAVTQNTAASSFSPALLQLLLNNDQSGSSSAGLLGQSISQALANYL